ncbi:Vancomycin resistance protein YoaR, contains peptidoglycan-binding and VanW domains [Quadrisphaera granulorum]|uniref:Vancomycin resistance protein YoaR n=1 Tax=Quadrisphaera granulorum TaxID=317664 RepID=A0A316AF22_9ACTN|nr:VanW family protein [Quadrisphaera granulorum]PWJ56172.1 vancomycin resistance protein YoaR [Quadrisphaera granulorum]SZE94806.1 Vancomycin resistance protein YoaR, contains peptidoglycan-binding and VanW domains [Quadrisphaera granulorum]
MVMPGGAAQLLEMLERSGESERGTTGVVPAPRRPQHRRERTAAGSDADVLVLPETGAARVAGPPAPQRLAGLVTEPVLEPVAGHLAGPFAAAPPSTTTAAATTTTTTTTTAVMRGQRIRVLALVAAAGLVAAAWSGVSTRLADRVPDGTTVAGVAIGGLDRTEAVTLLARMLEPRLTQPLEVRLDAPLAQGRTTAIDPAVADLRLDAAATVSRAIGPVGLPTTLWHQLSGRGAVEPVLRGDPADLASAVERAAVALDVPPTEGSISFASGAPVVVPPVEGAALDRDAAADLVRRAWLAGPGEAGGERPLALPATSAAPHVSADALAEALRTQAAPAVAGPLTVVVGERSVVLPPAAVVPALSVGADADGLRLHVDGAALAAAVATADPSTLTPAQDARLDTSGAVPVVVPAVPGAEPDPQALAASAAEALVASGDERTARVATRAVEPALTTEALTAMGITTLLGQVVSPLTADPARTQDVTVAARALDGAVLAQGQSLDVGARLGEPSAEAGWVPAVVVVDGRATSTLSAGTTQVASAVHAAAYAAGLQVDARTAPESWNPRDPVGLDAVVEPDAPLQLSEVAGPGAVLRVEVVDGALRVQVWGPAGRTVTLSTSPATDVRTAPQLSDPSPRCVPQPGMDGFTATVTRTITPQGGQPATDDLVTTYAPRAAITCTAAAVGGLPPSLD